MTRRRKKKRNEEPPQKKGESIELKIRTFQDKIIHSGRYNINSEKDLEDLVYILIKLLNIDLDKLSRNVKKIKEKQ